MRLESLFAGRRIAAIDLSQAVDIRPQGVLLDNTLPVLRYSEIDRRTLQSLAGGVKVPAAENAAAEVPRVDASVAVDAAATAAAAAANDAAALALGVAAPDPELDDATPPGRDARADVMADYFDVMRGFLEQQRAVVESWQARSDESPAESPVVRHDLPFLGELVEQDEHRLVVRCPLSLDDNFLRSHVLSGPVSENVELSGLACVPLMVSVEIMAEACSLLAGRADVQVIENVRAFDWIALDDDELTLEVHAELVDAAEARYRSTVFNGAEPMVSAEFRFAPDWQLPVSHRSVSPGPRSGAAPSSTPRACSTARCSRACAASPAGARAASTRSCSRPGCRTSSRSAQRRAWC